MYFYSKDCLLDRNSDIELSAFAAGEMLRVSTEKRKVKKTTKGTETTGRRGLCTYFILLMRDIYLRKIQSWKIVCTSYCTNSFFFIRGLSCPRSVFGPHNL
jgi:hypothetical protein